MQGDKAVAVAITSKNLMFYLFLTSNSDEKFRTLKLPQNQKFSTMKLPRDWIEVHTIVEVNIKGLKFWSLTFRVKYFEVVVFEVHPPPTRSTYNQIVKI